MAKKSIILFVISFTVFQIASAQSFGFEKQDASISGNVSVQNVENKNNYEFTARGGFMLSNNFSLGFFSLISQDFNASSMSMAGLYGRYYITPTGRFSLFGNLDIGFGLKKNLGAESTMSTYHFSPGISYFITESLALESTIGEIGFSSEKLSKPSGSRINTFYSKLNFSSINIGIRYNTKK
jgi:opacity protein-like surface antigen